MLLSMLFSDCLESDSTLALLSKRKFEINKFGNM